MPVKVDDSSVLPPTGKLASEGNTGLCTSRYFDNFSDVGPGDRCIQYTSYGILTDLGHDPHDPFRFIITGTSF